MANLLKNKIEKLSPALLFVFLLSCSASLLADKPLPLIALSPHDDAAPQYSDSVFVWQLSQKLLAASANPNQQPPNLWQLEWKLSLSSSSIGLQRASYSSHAVMNGSASFVLVCQKSLKKWSFNTKASADFSQTVDLEVSKKAKDAASKNVTSQLADNIVTELQKHFSLAEAEEQKCA